VREAGATSARGSRGGRSCSCPIASPRSIAATAIWADSGASVERMNVIYARRAPRPPEGLFMNPGIGPYSACEALRGVQSQSSRSNRRRRDYDHANLGKEISPTP
jgi:hypothetical protein